MYHGIAMDGPEALRQWRVTPAAFEEQLRYLRDSGFRSTTLDEWREARERSRPLPGRRVLITFDDGYADFAEHAWPLLRRYGFSALVFVVTDRVGETADWDAALGGGAPLLTWDAIRTLHGEGVSFGSHSASHANLMTLTPEHLVRELAMSRSALEAALGVPVTSVAYPFGECDAAVSHLAGACGYEYGLRAGGGPTGPREPWLLLSRIEMTGDDTLDTLVAKLHA